ncbi:hypothetical protein RHGRI_014888 [Rhododendron griersonianum]|uniref:F-box associated beta-propeller type 1 domain-containing protein n=1 Tax=Rhododendron griersonianum TaxID=479676 RepID=A0AAV6KBS3_9ERIC|nr:hypothetical protein RHGRI_014888 [Rhododendron griersonianum]
MHKHSDTAVELDFPFKVPHRLIRNVGCCDGLVCVAVGRKVFLWNPSTRKFVTLPDAEMPYHCGETFGFGYDESIDDYKVVRFFSSTRCREVPVKVYTLRSDSWRRIGDFPHRGFPEGLGTFVNGSLHWIVVNESYNIVSLDLAKETYGEVLQPEYGDGYLHDITLDILNGCLCIVRYRDSCADVWVMKEYGIRESWTKLGVVPRFSHPIDRLRILKNGEVLVHTQDHLVRYSPKDGTFSHLTVHNRPWFFGQYPYVESLVSPHVDADSGVMWQHQY